MQDQDDKISLGFVDISVVMDPDQPSGRRIDFEVSEGLDLATAVMALEMVKLRLVKEYL